MVFQRRRASAAVAVAGALVLGVALVAPVAAAGPTIAVVASGLDNPRGISSGPDGRIVVAEAGRGGAGAGGFGLSGRIVEIDHGRVRVLLAGLPSIISPEGEVSGPVGVSSTWFGRTSVTIGGGPQDVDGRFDSLLKTNRGHARTVADIQAFRNVHPDTTDLDQPPNPTDSNAYGVAALSRGRTLVTDAAGNDLLLVDVHGKRHDRCEVPERARLDLPPPALPGHPGGHSAPGRGSAHVGDRRPGRLLVRRRAEGLPVHAGHVADLADRAVGAERRVRPGGHEGLAAPSSPTGSPPSSASTSAPTAACTWPRS